MPMAGGGRSSEGPSASKGVVVVGHASTSSTTSASHQNYWYEGERLSSLLQSIQRKIESARLVDNGNALPEKIWFKQQFSIGVNEVTRVLERMTPTRTSKSAKLQAILIASDSNPRWLTKHLPSLALSRNVPLLFLKDNKQASLRLAQLFKLNTAIAIGVKAKGNPINQLLDEILGGNGETHCPN